MRLIVPDNLDREGYVNIKQVKRVKPVETGVGIITWGGVFNPPHTVA